MQEAVDIVTPWSSGQLFQNTVAASVYFLSVLKRCGITFMVQQIQGGKQEEKNLWQHEA